MGSMKTLSGPSEEKRAYEDRKMRKQRKRKK